MIKDEYLDYYIRHGWPPGMDKEPGIVGRCVHCKDNITDDEDGYYDFDGDIELVHEDCVFDYARKKYYRRMRDVM